MGLLTYKGKIISKPNSIMDGLISFWSFDNDSLDYTESIAFGYLYNYYVVTDHGGIANTGWRVPSRTDAESVLESYLGGNDVAGGKLKETGNVYWDNNVGASNSSGFNGRGSGQRIDTGSFSSLREFGYFWTTTTSGSKKEVQYLRNDTDDGLYRTTRALNFGNLIRLVKISTTLSNGQQGTYTGNDGRVYQTICIGTQEWVAHDLVETKYNDGTDIPEITDNTTWSGLISGARCSYDNDESNALTTVLNSTSDLHRDNIGTITGVSPQNGIINEGFYFNGVDDFVDIFDVSWLNSNIGNQGSISCWVKISSFPSSGFEFIFEHFGFVNDRFYLNISNNNLMYFSFGSGSVETTTLSTDQWYFVVCTWDGINISININNGQYTNITTEISRVSFTGNNWGLGKSFSSNDRYFNGYIDEMGIWSKVLLNEEIGDLYNNGQGLNYNKFRYGNI